MVYGLRSNQNMLARWRAAGLCLFGDLRGFHRSAIRTETAAAAKLAPESLLRKQHELLIHRVKSAYHNFAAYREKVRQAGLIEEDIISVDDISRLPVWTREDQNKLYDSLKTPPLPAAIAHATGGSTGSPTRFYITRESYEWRRAVSDRGYAWAGAEPGKRTFFVWGAPISPPARLNCLKEGLVHLLERRRFFNSFAFSENEMLECIQQINAFKPDALVGYAGNLVHLAMFAQKQSRRLLKAGVKSVVTAAEGLHPGQRDLLEEVFGGKVFRSYGSREFMLIGMECEKHRGYHLCADNLYTEVVDDDNAPLPPGEAGRILVTDLHNDANPFVRYEIGDYGVMAAGACECGRPFPLLARVEGRIQEFIKKPDGSKMTALFLPHLMKEFDQVQGYQLIQEDAGEYVLNVVSKNHLTEPVIAAIQAALIEKLGAESKVAIKMVNALTKIGSGKTPMVIRR